VPMMNFGNILGVFGVQNWGRSGGVFEGTSMAKFGDELTKVWVFWGSEIKLNWGAI
jgi:hypothetical protein